MATTFGLTPTGFVPLTTEDARTSIKEEIAGEFGASFDMSDGSAAGHVIGIVAAAAGELWEVTEQLANSTNRDAATGVRLDEIGALTGTPRNGADKSTVTVTLTGDPLTVVTTGFRAATASTGAPFETLEDTVLVALTAWVGSTAYVAGDRVTNGSKAYVCTTAGTSASSGGPTTEALTISDGSGALEWAWLGNGTAADDLEFTAVDDGVVIAAVRDLTVILNPTVGLQNVTNLAEAVEGVSIEADGPYRIRQVEELALAGAGTAAAIRSKLLALADVIQAHVFMNLTDTTDGDGVPPHAIEALVQGGDEQEIVDLLGEQVGVGIVTVGTTSGSHTDSEGTTFTVNFSRPTQLLIYDRITLTKNATTYVGDASAKAAVVVYGDAEQVIGKDLIPSSVAAAILPVKVGGVQVAGVTGVLKIVRSDAYTDVIGSPVAWVATTAYVATPGSRSVVTNDGGRAYICTTGGTSAGSGGPTGEGTAIADGSVVWSWLGADIVVTARQIAVVDDTRITISSSSATP